MKRRRIAEVLLGSLLICGCSEGYASDYSDTGVYEDAYDGSYGESYEEAYEEAATITKEEEDTDLMLKYTGNVDIEVSDIKEGAAKIDKIVEDHKGYVYERSQSNKMDNEYMDYCCKVPADDFKKILTELEGVGEVNILDTYAEDITKGYTDVTRKIEFNNKKLDRLMKLMDQADKMEDIIKIQDEVLETEQLLQQLTVEKEDMTEDVEYADLRIYLSEKETVKAETSVIGEAWDGTMPLFIGFVSWVLALIILLMPYVLFIGLPVGLVIWVWRRKKGNKNKPEDGTSCDKIES